MADFAKVAEQLAWPIAAILIVGLLIFFMPRIGNSFKSSPLIRRIKLSSFEIELDRRELDNLKETTDAQVLSLIKKIDDQTMRFARNLRISSAIESALQNIISSKPVSDHIRDEKSKFRATLHIFDPVFEDQLFQLYGYFFEDGKRSIFKQNRGSGRRFSIRYGIIGLAARTGNSQGVGSAFKGDDDEVQALIERWSMLPEQTKSASRKTSCLVVVLREEKTGAPIGLLYADAEIENFFGDDGSACEFAARCEKLPKVKALAKLTTELDTALTEIRVGFDLVKIGEKN